MAWDIQPLIHLWYPMQGSFISDSIALAYPLHPTQKKCEKQVKDDPGHKHAEHFLMSIVPCRSADEPPRTVR